MQKNSKRFIVLVCGWLLGWYSHLYWSAPQRLPLAGRGVDTEGAHEFQNQRAQNFSREGSVAPGTAQHRPVGVRQLLDARRYQDVVDLLAGQESGPGLDHTRMAIIEHIGDLLEDKAYRYAAQLLSVYLEYDYRDVDALLLHARLLQLQLDYQAAIDALYEAKSYEYRTPRIADINKRIRRLVAEYNKRLREAGEHQQRLALYEQLVQLEPDYSPYFIELAGALLNLDRPAEARSALALVESDPRVAKQARQMLSRMDSTVSFVQAAPVVIPLMRQGDHFVVEAWINNTVPVRLLIDTGASMTVLSHGILSAAGVSKPAQVPVRQFNTANGLVEGTVYVVDGLSIADQRVANMEIAGLELPGMHSVDGLLGMNFLKHFRFFIDQSRQELRLSEPL